MTNFIKTKCCILILMIMKNISYSLFENRWIHVVLSVINLKV